MRISQYYLATLKEVSSDTESISHQLMLRSGMIYKVASGLYSWLPTGLRVLKKIKKIIRYEMNKIGAIEILMPIMHPRSLWKKSGRYNEYGLELFKLTDRRNKEFILSPTNEELITQIICHEINNYKKFPMNFYQIYSKFRDEIRPKYGMIRAKEFIMKDAYSFHTNQESLEDSYHIMYQTYNIIFKRLNLNFFCLPAETGRIGGCISHEFLAYCNQTYIKNYFNKKKLNNNNVSKINKLRLVEDKNVRNMSDLSKKFNVHKKRILKIILVHSNNKAIPFIGLALRDDHILDINKAEQLYLVKKPLKILSNNEINLHFKIHINYLGPINLKCLLIVDYYAILMKNFISGANINNKYFFDINWYRDVAVKWVTDLRYIEKKNITIKNKDSHAYSKSIEIGHIFQLGDKYTKVISLSNIKKNCHKNLFMGCYGIGISRLISAYIEQHHDDHGIIWNQEIAPFHVAIIPIHLHRSEKVKQVSEKIYYQLCNSNIEVLFDDRFIRPGVMFSDIELIGIPHILIISENNLKTQQIEHKNRITGQVYKVSALCITDYILKILKKKF
ncbi:prolyl-tRNA synthetase [Wigglesworthia glossinidia endosymbiont of Glossina morsitans morsitans (Yale colony)]|uniref:Proline--tRNA ligase n=1 Tax=Wigglesworthia glossinidia endosymbiont of Glossina morsitans morsitans (Yale colony) TaxID=1142511 RepID=H6Q4D8_WIGGL|nr:proline--tRNA ligase [Wigglesworthia glossinidia]AFA40998.1 prolyl-tRNA synthetase [Wigglesworthia glossinidia endosymbiont of Glossina morsitans morsitans (Yale colony)]